jgi:hypothetical protein
MLINSACLHLDAVLCMYYGTAGALIILNLLNEYGRYCIFDIITLNAVDLSMLAPKRKAVCTWTFTRRYLFMQFQYCDGLQVLRFIPIL